MAKRKVSTERQNEIADKWNEICSQPGEVKRETAERLTKIIYEDYFKEPCPAPEDIEIHPSPRTAWEALCRRVADSEENYQELVKEIELPSLAGRGDAVFYVAIDIALESGEKPEDCDAKLLELSEVSWVWPMPGFCIFADLPRTLKLNEDKEIHCDDGPAIEYVNGEKRWFINGHKVDEQIVMHPETQTVEQVLNESNGDIRTIRAERYGWLKLLDDCGDVSTLDERNNEVEGTYEVLYKTPFGKKLVATCITGRIPVLSIPSDITNVEDAQLFLGGELPILGVEQNPWWKHQGINRINVIGRT